MVIELSSIPIDDLLHEIERRQFKERKVEHRWICDACGAVAIGGRNMGDVCYAEAGRVWCRTCDPGRPDFYGTRGRQSIPMRHETTEGKRS